MLYYMYNVFVSLSLDGMCSSFLSPRDFVLTLFTMVHMLVGHLSYNIVDTAGHYKAEQTSIFIDDVRTESTCHGSRLFAMS